MADRKWFVRCLTGCLAEGMTKEQILTAIKQAIETGTIQNVDTGFITKIVEQNKQTPLSFWVGTSAEYNAIENKNEDCFYIITDKAEANGFLKLEDITTEINKNSTDDKCPTAKAVYKYGQEVLSETEVTATAQGNAITIESSKAPLQQLKLYGKTTQDGTPTPENPIELKSVGDSGSFNVELYGTNLLEQTCKSQSYYGLTVTVNEDKSVTLNGTPTVTWMHTYRNVIAYLKVGETYHFSGFNALMMGKNGIETYPTGGLITITEDMTYLVPYLQVQANKTLNRTFYPKITHLKELPYEPPTKQALTMPYTLRSVGDIKDEVDFNRGVLIQRVAELDLGVLNLTYIEGNKNFYVQTYSLNALLPTYNWQKANMVCSRYIVDNADNVYTSKTNGTISLGKGGEIRILDDRYTDATAFKNAMSGTKLLYVLATPTETPLTETELNAYRQLYTNKGNTTILSEATAEVDYYINKPNAQAVGNIHSQVNADYIKIQQAIISLGGNV